MWRFACGGRGGLVEGGSQLLEAISRTSVKGEFKSRDVVTSGGQNRVCWWQVRTTVYTRLTNFELMQISFQYRPSDELHLNMNIKNSTCFADELKLLSKPSGFA